MLKETGEKGPWNLLKVEIPIKTAKDRFSKAFNFNFGRGKKTKSSKIKKAIYEVIKEKMEAGKTLEVAVAELKKESDSKEISMLEYNRHAQIYYEVSRREQLFNNLRDAISSAKEPVK